MNKKELWDKYESQFNSLAEKMEKADIEPTLLAELTETANKLGEAGIKV